MGSGTSLPIPSDGISTVDKPQKNPCCLIASPIGRWGQCPPGPNEGHCSHWSDGTLALSSLVAMKKVRAAMRPSISLSPDDARELRTLSADLERELLRSYETFLFRDRRCVDESQWKPVKTQENFQCFRERKSYKRQTAGSLLTRSPPPPSVSPRDSEDSIEIGPQAALAANCKVPLLLGTGTIAGTVDDALYGGSFHDTRSLRARNMYINEVMEETAVLGVVDGPTHGEPFRFLGVIWYYKTYPVPGLILNRDVLMVAAIHETELSNGERVSVALHHSIEHRDAPIRRDLSILRADFSLAILYRQIDPLRLDLFVTMFVDPKGSTPFSFVLPDSIRSMLTTTTICEAAFRRKLFRRMLEAQHLRKRQGSRIHEDDSNCALCDKKTSGLFALSGSTCQICRRRVCSKCSITKDLLVESTRSSYTSKPFDFCLVCTLETRDVPAVTLAREELYERTLLPRSQHASSVSSTSTGPLE